jgi:predicted transcriptional regulator of viral defense system
MGNSLRRERFASVVRTQHGRVTWAQLKQLGLSNGAITSWIGHGHLVRVLPKVYAVGHVAPSREADLWAAVLYAGPGAMLSHGTAAHWRGLIRFAPPRIEVSTPRDVKSDVRVRVYPRRDHRRVEHEGLPVTPDPQTLVDLAATGSLRAVRRALAVLDFRRELDVRAIESICERGRPGSTRLRAALEIHQPELAHTNGAFEERFLEWCERWEVPVPEFNTYVHNVQVDAHWPGTKLVVELDGGDNHHSVAQLHGDMTNDLHLRRHGITVRRYRFKQLAIQGRQIRDEILAGLDDAQTPEAA